MKEASILLNLKVFELLPDDFDLTEYQYVP